MTDKNEQPVTSNQSDTTPETAAQPSVESDTVSSTEINITNTNLQGDNNILSENTEAKNKELVISHETPTVENKVQTPVTADISPTPSVKADVQPLPTIADDEAEGTEPVELMDFGNTTNDLQQAAIKALAMKAEKERLEREAKMAKASAEQTLFDDNMTLRLDVVESGQAIALDVVGDLIVGRADNVTDYMPEIDLTPHGAYRYGLSRRHALIRRHEGSLLVKDLSSRNGTFVNGEQVKAGETHPLKDGDELRFGNLALRVNFLRKS